MAPRRSRSDRFIGDGVLGRSLMCSLLKTRSLSVINRCNNRSSCRSLYVRCYAPHRCSSLSTAECAHATSSLGRAESANYVTALKIIRATAESPPAAVPALMAQFLRFEVFVPHLPLPIFPVVTLNVVLG